VDGADPGAGQHGNSQFRDHGEINSNTVALFDTLFFQNVGEFVDFPPELFVSKGLGIANVAFKYDGGLVLAPGVKMAVETVVGNIKFAAYEPFVVGILEVIDKYLIPLLEPVDLLGLLGPEAFHIFYRALVDLLILRHALDISIFNEFFGRRELTVFHRHRGDG